MPRKAQAPKCNTMMLEHAQAGFDSGDVTKCKFYFSSDTWIAYACGVWMKHTGRSRPTFYKPSRGYYVLVDKIKLHWKGFEPQNTNYGKTAFQRVS
jgi:hypothetical protein